MISHECPKTTSSLKNGKIYTGCDLCLPSLVQKGSSATFDRRWQQVEYRREITQPLNPREFIKAYPAVAREKYDDETYRKFS